MLFKPGQLMARGKGGGVAGFNPSTLFASSEDGALFDPSDLTSLYQERTGASATTPAGVGDVVGTMLDLSGNGNHAVAPSDAARPILRQSGGLYYLEYDGVDDEFEVFISGLSATSTYAVAINPGIDANYMLLVRGDLGAWVGAAQDSSVSAVNNNTGSPTFRRDGATFSPSNRDDLHDGLTGNTSVVVAEGADLSAWSSIRSYNSTWFLDGNIYAQLIIDRAMTSDERASLEAWLAGKSGVTLP